MELVKFKGVDGTSVYVDRNRVVTLIEDDETENSTQITMHGETEYVTVVQGTPDQVYQILTKGNRYGD